jgi:hypothetical protein
MSVGGRAQLRSRNLRRAAIVAGLLVLLALLLLASGHWIVGIVFGVLAAGRADANRALAEPAGDGPPRL